MSATYTTQIGWNLDNSYARLPESLYAHVFPKPVSAPELVMINSPLAKSMGLDPDKLWDQESVAVLAGNRVPEGTTPLAQAYAGHQFGHFTMLGDGRAVLIGEQIAPSGKRLDIQLKGSGRTPYSRGGDGRATLGPMLREYIISEAMYHLGIPTTRSLAVTTTGEVVLREADLPGAVLTRVAASHIRVGTFQYAVEWCTLDELRVLADYTINRHFSHVKKEGDNPYVALLHEVVNRQASLIAKWQLVGFVHGVMNTDNMTVSGETIDYGPCAFLDTYDPDTVFSSIDTHGRYAYQNQPRIAQWNLARFAETLLPLIDEDLERAVELAQTVIEQFSERFHEHWLSGMRAKLGMVGEEGQDEVLVKELLRLLAKYETDYTNFFRAITLDKTEGIALFDSAEFRHWHQEWQARLARQDGDRIMVQELMTKHNPAVIPRNHRVEEALQAAVHRQDYSVMECLLDVLSDPFAYTAEQEEYSIVPEPSGVPYRTHCGT